MISKAERVNSLLPAFLLSTAESVGCLQYLSLRVGLAVSSTSLRKPSIISRYYNVLQEKIRKVYLEVNYGSFRTGAGGVGGEATWHYFLAACWVFVFLLCTSQDFPGDYSFGLAHSWIVLLLDFQYSMISQNGSKWFTHPLNGAPFLSECGKMWNPASHSLSYTTLFKLTPACNWEQWLNCACRQEDHPSV